MPIIFTLHPFIWLEVWKSNLVVGMESSPSGEARACRSKTDGAEGQPPSGVLGQEWGRRSPLKGVTVEESIRAALELSRSTHPAKARSKDPAWSKTVMPSQDPKSALRLEDYTRAFWARGPAAPLTTPLLLQVPGCRTALRSEPSETATQAAGERGLLVGIWKLQPPLRPPSLSAQQHFSPRALQVVKKCFISSLAGPIHPRRALWLVRVQVFTQRKRRGSFRALSYYKCGVSAASLSDLLSVLESSSDRWTKGESRLWGDTELVPIPGSGL